MQGQSFFESGQDGGPALEASWSHPTLKKTRALVEQHRVTNRASALLSNFGVVLVVELGFRGKAPPPRAHEILPDASDLPVRQAGDLHDVGVGALNVEMIVVGQQRNPCPPR